MDKSEIHKRVCTAIDGSWAAHIEALTNMETSVADLGFDSLDMVEARMAIEDEFTIEIDDDKFDGCKTVGDIVDLVERCHG